MHQKETRLWTETYPKGWSNIIENLMHQCCADPDGNETGQLFLKCLTLIGF